MSRTASAAGGAAVRCESCGFEDEDGKLFIRNLKFNWEPIPGQFVCRDAEACYQRWSAIKPDKALEDFRESMARHGCAWTGDVREVSAWHAEDPERSGWWEGGAPVFSLTVRRLMEA